MELFNDNLVVTKNQMENILKRNFKNDKHWEIFTNNFTRKPKSSFYELYRWSEIELWELTSRD